MIKNVYILSKNRTRFDEEESLLHEKLPDTSEDEVEQHSPNHLACRIDSLIFDVNLQDIIKTHNILYLFFY